MSQIGNRIGRGLSRRVRMAVVLARDAVGPRPPRPAATSPELRILFVCLGNICRSPLAEGIMRAKLAATGFLGRVEVDSAGTSDWNVGRPPDDRARLVAQRHGISIGDLRGRALRPEDFHRFDRIVVFDRENVAAARALAPDDAARSRVRLLRGESGEVADPITGTIEDFETAFRVIQAGCDALFEDVLASLP